MQSQASININDMQPQISQENSSPEIISHFEDAEKYRDFNYNPELRKLNQANIGDTILLDFFEDKKYKAIIKKVTIDKEGITAVTSQIINTKFGYCYISISDKGILISAELPESDEQYDALKVNGQSYLSQYKRSVAKEKELECSEPIIPEKTTGFILPDTDKILQSENIEDSRTIDVMVVYTQAAKNWADSYSSGIDNVISVAMEKSNLVMRNSATGISFNLVYKYQTDYIETNSNLDLSRLQGQGDGYLDEVHTLREQYKADLIVFMPMVSFTGGVAYLLSNENGNKDWCSFSLTRVQQAATGYTVVHEIGHNMGCGHHKDQNYQAGPGLFSYSAGWRGSQLGGYTTIMSYESGTYYSDGKTYPRIPYFSSPDISLEDIAIGHTANANNVLTLKKTKHVTSQYTKRDYQILLSVINHSKIYGDNDPVLGYNIIEESLKPDDKIQLERQSGEDAGTYPITARIMRGNDDVTTEYEIIITGTNVFTIAPRDLTLNLENKVITYTGKPIYIDIPTIDGLVNGDEIEISYTYSKTKGKTENNYASSPGEYKVTATVSGNTNYNDVSTTVTLKVVYDFNDIAKVKWNNTLMLKVAKLTKDGFQVSSCQWYKNGSVIHGATSFSYSAGPESTDLLDEAALYSVYIKTQEGTIESTQSSVKLKSFNLKVYPNPQIANQITYLEADMDEDMLEGATAEIYDLSGNIIKFIVIQGNITPLSLPDNKGTYIIKFKGKDGFFKEIKAIVK